MKAEIITIGDEILIGQIVDTNSAWLGQNLNLHGIEVYQITSVHDSRDHILHALYEAQKHVDLVLITGGLGPTKDDITKQTLCEYFDCGMVFHQSTYDAIAERFRNRGIDMNKLNRDQALVPEACTILTNKTGTAPGMWFERDNTIFVSMPGVPHEMKYLMEHEVFPRLREKGLTRSIVHKTVLTQGIAESMLAEKIATWEESLPSFIRLAYLPNPMAVRLRLTATGQNESMLRSQIEAQIQKLHQLIGDYIYGYDQDTLGSVVGALLRARKQTLAVAESCTGGLISHLITVVPGCSEYFLGAVTAYANSVKISQLGVAADSLQTHGAVSEQVAVEMAEGVRRTLGTDYGVATTGIAGPTGGTPEKPVGTVWIAWAGPNGTKAERFVFVGDHRERNIVRAAHTALQGLRRFILANNE